MKKLLHIVLYLPYGGLEKLVFDFSTALNGMKYEVHVAALQEGGPMQDKLEQAGIPVHVLGKRPGKIDLKLLTNLIKLIRRLHIDVIHSHSGCIMYASLAGKLAGVKKIIHTEHGKYLPEPWSRILEDRIFSNLITKYVCVSKELKEYVLNTTKIPEKKVEIIINGIDASNFFKYPLVIRHRLRHRYNLKPTDVVLGTVCRLIPEKNVTFLITWFKKYFTAYKYLILIIVGDGPQRTILEEEALGIPEGRIRFLGARGEIPDLMNIFDIFSLVSTTEGTSLTILEAMASQLPVIASAVGGNIEIIENNINGMLFESNDLGAFDDCIARLLVMRDRGYCIGKHAEQIVKEKYSFGNMLTQYKSLYSS